jgi:hypothetical protein
MRSEETARGAPVIGKGVAVALTGLRAAPYIRHGLRGPLSRADGGVAQLVRAAES